MPNSDDEQTRTPTRSITPTTVTFQGYPISETSFAVRFEKRNPMKTRLENKTPEEFEDSEDKKKARCNAITNFLRALPEVISLDFDQTITKHHSHHNGAENPNIQISENFAKNLFNAGDVEFWNDFFDLAKSENKIVLINSFQYESIIRTICSEAGINLPEDLKIIGAEHRNKDNGGKLSKLESLQKFTPQNANVVHFDDDADKEISRGFDQIFYSKDELFLSTQQSPSPKRFYKKYQSQPTSEVESVGLYSAHEKLEITLSHEVEEDERARLLFAQTKISKFIEQIMSFSTMPTKTDLDATQDETPRTSVVLTSTDLSMPRHEFAELTNFIEFGYRKEPATQRKSFEASPFTFPLPLKKNNSEQSILNISASGAKRLKPAPKTHELSE